MSMKGEELYGQFFLKDSLIFGTVSKILIYRKSMTSTYRDSTYHPTDKETLWYNSMKLLFDLTNKYIEKGYTTPEKIAENIDEHTYLMSGIQQLDVASAVWNQVHLGLYCKTIKNLGTEKHQ